MTIMLIKAFFTLTQVVQNLSLLKQRQTCNPTTAVKFWGFQGYLPAPNAIFCF